MTSPSGTSWPPHRQVRRVAPTDRHLGDRRRAVRILSFFRDYACRHSGACCNAGWIEPHSNGRCRYYDGHPGGSCSVHRASGEAALPQACRQFPRVATLSPVGVSVTLSAFCPTAASLLFGPDPFRIVEAADHRVYEGLDATTVMPPLLRPGMLMDWESVVRWEELAVATLSTHRHHVDRALSIIEQASEEVCATWTPGGEALATALSSAFTEVAGISAAPSRRGRAKERSRLRSFDAVTAETPATSSALARYLAAHAFACWPMYQGRGIRGAVEWLVKARTALDEERRSQPDLKAAFRQADLRLRHSTSPP